MSRLLGKSLAGLVLICGLAVGSAQGSPVTATFEKVGPGVGNAGQYNWNTGSTTYAGILYTPFGNGSSSANHIVMFCIEQDQFISGGTTYNNYQFASLVNAPVPAPHMTAAAAADIASMWAEYRSTVDTNNESAAFQHAIWHLVDPSYNPSLSGAVLGYYNTYLNSSTWQSGQASLAAMIHPQYQDQVFELKDNYIVGPDGNIVQVPAPATLAVALLIAPALLIRRRLAK